MRFDQPYDVRYATSDGLDIAYQVVGTAPLDLLYVPGYISNLELAWEDRGYERLLRQLSSFSRLIAMDKRGTGLSARGISSQAVEDHVRDIGVVLDAAGSHRAAILGAHEGASAALLYAAANPDRVLSVVAYCTRAKCIASDDYPIGWPPELIEQWLEATTANWGVTRVDDVAGIWGPSRVGDTLLMAELGRFFRLSATVKEALSVLRMYIELDIRSVLDSLRVPVLVLNREDDVLNPVVNARFLADRLPNATLQLLPGDETPIWWGDIDAVVREVRTFLTGTETITATDRVLATVLFTDFVGSTRQNVSLGDRRWREVLDRHDEHVRGAIERYGGRLVKSTGDGILATFDGPARAIRCGDAIRQTLPSLGLQVRTGIHTGEVEERGNDVAGIAITLANRIMSQAGASEILVSRTVTDLVAGSGIAFRDRGTHQLKGIPQEWQLFEVASV